MLRIRSRLSACAAVLAALVLTSCSPGAPLPNPLDPSESTDPPSASPSAGPSDHPDRPGPAVPDVEPEGFVDAPPGTGMARYHDQDVTWLPCGAALCADVSAPLDHEEPDGQAITLRMLKVPATAEPRLGTVFVNPGGPGYPGTSLAAGFDRTGLEQYDVVGWDPRGVGSSTPVTCFQGEDHDAFTAMDTSPDDSAEEQALIVANRSFGQSCLERSGPLLEHISSVQTVRDLDLLRVLVGDERLSYVGYSYGTYLGALYAELYPDRVGRLVLDGAVDLSRTSETIQAQGFDRSLNAFAGWCVAQGCSLGEDPTAVVEQVTRVFDQTDVQPMPTRSDRQLTQSLAVTGVISMLYSETRWPALLQVLELAREGDGSGLLFYADEFNERGADGRYGQSAFAFPATSCADTADGGIEDALQDWERAQELAPVFGRYGGPALTCPVWPVEPDVWEQPIRGAGAAPVLVVGTTGDSATPYEYSVAMAEQLESAQLLTLEGEGHGAFRQGTPCIDGAVVRYLVTGELPPPGTRCRE
ncbi:alpha/beta hydrolase [Desertihabitans aurantiacus]|uniref:alpha/beta hydrolase n=1 Tax=Desertihabitans aurantiacus TaxID=2282477 RepID=UPI001300892D|nr:alpha/beta hydrolase [Desertihabitans aurantiacus]